VESGDSSDDETDSDDDIIRGDSSADAVLQYLQDIKQEQYERSDKFDSVPTRGDGDGSVVSRKRKWTDPECLKDLPFRVELSAEEEKLLEESTRVVKRKTGQKRGRLPCCDGGYRCKSPRAKADGGLCTQCCNNGYSEKQKRTAYKQHLRALARSDNIDRIVEARCDPDWAARNLLPQPQQATLDEEALRADLSRRYPAAELIALKKKAREMGVAVTDEKDFAIEGLFESPDGKVKFFGTCAPTCPGGDNCIGTLAGRVEYVLGMPVQDNPVPDTGEVTGAVDDVVAVGPAPEMSTSAVHAPQDSVVAVVPVTARPVNTGAMQRVAASFGAAAHDTGPECAAATAADEVRATQANRMENLMLHAAQSSEPEPAV
jgi:hypothetical protein